MSRLADNITGFARLLRTAGLPITIGHIQNAINAVAAVGVAQRPDMKSALFATLVSATGQREIFDQMFDAYWQDPELFEKALSALLPRTVVPAREPDTAPGARRVAEAFRQRQQEAEIEIPSIIEMDARNSATADETLSHKDFEQMSSAELATARRTLASRHWKLPTRRSRRTEPSSQGRQLDVRRTLRNSMRTGGNILHLERLKQKQVEPPLVILCDISGSMSVYARMCLHFFHGLTQSRRVKRAATHTFLFGTRLTNISRALRLRDPDEALAQASNLTQDWDGGTRIAHALQDFNARWSRRVLGQGATVLLITDGLERDEPEALRKAASHLHRSTRRLVWLNPLLRYDGFAPRAQGIRILLDNVDELRPVHSLKSIADLADALAHPGARSDLERLKGVAA
jgi:uncharacterized protein with von Willebrand factor type A (vWA) domain